jgi:hypothetical protein
MPLRTKCVAKSGQLCCADDASVVVVADDADADADAEEEEAEAEEPDMVLLLR